MKHSWLIALCLSIYSLNAINELKISVYSGNYKRTDCVVSVDLNKLNLQNKEGVSLYEIINGESKRTDCQIIHTEGDDHKLYWILKGTTEANTKRDFIIKKENRNNSNKGMMKVVDNNHSLILKKKGHKILEYVYETCIPPKDIDPVFMKSGFIHPAYSPSGNVLTRIQPKDHPHHYGIWNPWSKVEYEGNCYNLWYLILRQGTVKANNIENIYQGKICAGFNAKLDQIIYTPKGPKKITDETWNVKSWNVPDGFLWDFESDLIPSTDKPVIIRQYRYGGFSLRATGDWTRENCEFLTSEGKTREEIDGTTARWIYVTGECANKERSGIIYMSHPENINHPEPMRIWNEKMSKRGEVYINFNPTKFKDWKLEVGKHHKLRYRVFTYDGEMTAEKAERLWRDYAYPPKVSIIN